VLDLERSVARAGQGVGAGGLVVAIYVTLFVSRQLGFLSATIAITSLWWFYGVYWALQQPRWQRAAMLVSPFFEISIPSLCLLAVYRAKGGAYAVGSWVPAELYTVFILSSILRLRRWLPAGLGLLAAVQYALIWTFLIAPEVGQRPETLYQPGVHWVRSVSLLLTGLAGTVAVIRLNRLIQRATKSARSHDLFGKYQLGDTVASGGMGRVVRATYCPEGGFERDVAIKLIHPHLADDEAFVRRFRTEARLCARLNHPNIVPALDFGVVDGQYFFAMDYVDGTTLTELLREAGELNRPIPLRITAHIGLEVARALHHAHAEAVDGRGRLLRVVHRDVSPGNVMVHRRGHVRVLDFGVAQAIGRGPKEATRTLVGKPSYMAPEQLSGGPVDARADLWSLSVVLWEMVTNEPLFRRDLEAATLLAVCQDAIPRVASLRPDAHPAWQTFFDHALQRDPNARFIDAEALCDALLVVQSAEGAATADDLAELVHRVTTDVEELELDLD